MTEKIGYVPNSVIYVCRPPTLLQTHWNGDSWNSRIGQQRPEVGLDLGAASPEEINLYKKDVIAAFPVSAGAANLEKSLETARDWAKYNGYQQSHPTVYKEITRDNKPFSLQVVGLDIRTEGGRAYKVIDTDGHMFDLREDILFEALMTHGCLPSGYLSCEFVWCVPGRSGMKLVRDGSPLHQSLLRASQRRNADPILTADLKPGHVYRNKNLDEKLFVGWINAPKTKSGWKLVWLTGTVANAQILERLLSGIPLERHGYYYLNTAITTEHNVVESIADHSHLAPLFRSYLEKKLQEELQGAEANLQAADGYHSYYREDNIKDCKRRVSELKRDLKACSQLQFQFESVKEAAPAPT